MLSEDVVNSMIDGAWHTCEYQGMIGDLVDPSRMSSSKQQRRRVSTIAEATPSKEQIDDRLNKAQEHHDNSWDIDIRRPPSTNLPEHLVTGAVLSCCRRQGPYQLRHLAPLGIPGRRVPPPQFHGIGGKGNPAQRPLIFVPSDEGGVGAGRR